MQRMPPNMPPRQNGTQNQRPASPALNMAQRIRSEQGAQRAAQYLMDMEPYLAPAERAHIAEQIGVTLPQRRTQPQPQPQNAGAPMGGMPFSGMPNGGMPNGANPFGGMPNGGNPMQLLQMLGGMPGAGMPGGMPGGDMGNMMQMAQMLKNLGPLLGGKK